MFEVSHNSMLSVWQQWCGFLPLKQTIQTNNKT